MSRLCIEVLTGVLRPLKKKSNIKKATVLWWLNEVVANEVGANHWMDLRCFIPFMPFETRCYPNHVVIYLFSSKCRRDVYVQSGNYCGTLGGLGGAGSVKIYLTFPTLSRLRSIGLAQLKTARQPMSRAIIFLPKDITAPSKCPSYISALNGRICLLVANVAYLINVRVSLHNRHWT